MFAHVVQLWITAVILVAMVGVYLHTTSRGKFGVWRKLLDGLALHGDERILDLGCGRGAVLLMAAACVPQGRAWGVDIWSTKDQSGNAMTVTRENATTEGVADRVELNTADMRQLPFESGMFDVIVANVAIHNISAQAGRDQAIDIDQRPVIAQLQSLALRIRRSQTGHSTHVVVSHRGYGRVP